MKLFGRIILLIVAVAAILLIVIRVRYGGGAAYRDLSAEPGRRLALLRGDDARYDVPDSGKRFAG